jgi:N-acetylglucosamine kinase-like BadF-type ATPase
MTQLNLGDYLLGINGGHQRASALLYVHGERLIRTAHLDNSLNIHAVGVEATKSRLADFLTHILSENGISRNTFKSRLKRLVVAFPGAALEYDHKLAKKTVDTALLRNAEIEIVDDTWAGLFSHTLERRGICAFAGAGASVSIANGSFVRSKEHKIDGWGPLIGDFGSGFDLVTRYFRGLGRIRDTNLKSALFALIQQHCKTTIPIKHIDQVQPWFDVFVKQHSSEWRAHFSELAIPILRAADHLLPASDDAKEEARVLVIETAKLMYQSIGLAIERFNDDFKRQPIPIVLQGGIFRNSKTYATFIKSKIKRLYGNDSILATRKPVHGALLLAAEPYGLHRDIERDLPSM